MATTEGTQEQRGPFGGLTPAEAGRKSAESRKKRLASEPDPTQGDPETLANMRKLARSGTGTTAVAAARYLDEVAGRTGARDQDVLALLTPEQRSIVRSWLSQSESDSGVDT